MKQQAGGTVGRSMTVASCPCWSGQRRWRGHRRGFNHLCRLKMQLRPPPNTLRFKT